MITKVALVLATALLLVAGDSDYPYEEEVPSTHVPHLLSVSEALEATIGETVTFPCKVDDLGDFVIVWKKGKGQILFAGTVKVVRDGRFQVLDETSLRISGVQPKDSGEYVCQISTMPPVELSHTLNVLYPPAVKPVPTSAAVTAKEGEKVTISCDATGNPEPSITWKHAGRIYESVNRRDYIFPSVQKTESGEYECIADNGIGEPDSAIITVDVVSAPKIYPNPKDGRVTVREGEPISMSCEATGDPVPVITWKKPGEYEAHSSLESEKITISEANRNHAGSYECIATNDMGIFTSFEIIVEVLYPPEIEVPTQTLHTGEGTTVNLTCIVRGEPVPTVTWTHGQRTITHSNEHYHVKNMGHSHILQIRHMRESDFGLYECIAHNRLSNSSATIDVMGTPQVPSFTSKPHGPQGRRYTLQWMVKSHSPIDEYSLIYKKKSEGEEWITIPVEPDDEEGELKTQTYQLTDLEPGTTYETVVRARNKFGWSKQSENFDFTTKHEVLPTKMTKEPTVAAAVIEEDLSKSNEVIPGGDGNDSSSRHFSFLAVVAQALILCILRPLVL